MQDGSAFIPINLKESAHFFHLMRKLLSSTAISTNMKQFKTNIL